MMNELDTRNAQIEAAFPDLVERLKAHGIDATVDGATVHVPMPQGFYVTVVADMGGWYAGAWTEQDLPATLADDNYVYASPVDDEGFVPASDTDELVQAITDLRSGDTTSVTPRSSRRTRTGRPWTTSRSCKGSRVATRGAAPHGAR